MRGHRIPGVSSSSTLLGNGIHWFCRVTPGFGPTCALLRSSKWFTNVDLPMFGTPAIMMRTGRASGRVAPRFARSSMTTFRHSSGRPRRVPVLRESSMNSRSPRFAYHSTHAFDAFASARSDLLATVRNGRFCRISRKSGLRDDIGARASISSTTRSTSFKASCMAFSAFIMCPGNQPLNGYCSKSMLIIVVYSCLLLSMARHRRYPPTARRRRYVLSLHKYPMTKALHGFGLPHIHRTQTAFSKHPE